MPCTVHMCMCLCMYVHVRSNPFGGATQCMEPYRYIVGNHAPPQMQGHLLDPQPSSDGGPSSYRVGGKPEPDCCDAQAQADACMASTGTAQHRIASHRIAGRGYQRPCPYHTHAMEQAVLRHDKHKARRIMDCSQLAPASHFLSFPCMRIKRGLHATKRWGLS